MFHEKAATVAHVNGKRPKWLRMQNVGKLLYRHSQIITTIAWR
jgi:hypothetical protein